MPEALLNYSCGLFLSVFFARLADSRKDCISVTIVKCGRQTGYEHCTSAWLELGCIKSWWKFELMLMSNCCRMPGGQHCATSLLVLAKNCGRNSANFY
uniref:Putative secreted protein n=1 Tax=Ixodes ricinus TaxID=34613 RepID=A0A6B0UE11_IXORI